MGECLLCGATGEGVCDGEPGQACFLVTSAPLLKRVAVLERALEEIERVAIEKGHPKLAQFARKALDEAG